MYEERQVPRLEAECGGHLRKKDLVDDIDFEEVISAAQSPQLSGSTFPGASAYFVRIGPDQASALFGVKQILGVTVAFLHRPPGTGFQDATLILRRKSRDGPGRADAGRNLLIQAPYDIGNPVLDRITDQTGPYEPDSSIDIVADTTR
jgi:hypothetical protein